MTRDSGSRPAGRDVKQARGEARQSGGAAASPEPGSPPQATATELLPCRECGLPCRVETFGNTELIAEPFDLFICCNHKRFGGYCPSDLAYFDADAWNTRPNQEATPLAHDDGSLTLDNASVQRLMGYGLLHRLDDGWHVGEWPKTNSRVQEATPAEFGDAGDALDFALGHCEPQEAMAFLDDWRTDRAGEWPGYVKWLAHQRKCAALRKKITVQEATRTVGDGEVVILSSICGKHFDGACQSCRAAKQDNDHRALLTKATRP